MPVDVGQPHDPRLADVGAPSDRLRNVDIDIMAGGELRIDGYAEQPALRPAERRNAREHFARGVFGVSSNGSDFPQLSFVVEYAAIRPERERDRLRAHRLSMPKGQRPLAEHYLLGPYGRCRYSKTTPL